MWPEVYSVQNIYVFIGGLDEPQVIPRFLNALMKAGADAHRIDSYITRIGSSPEQCHVEKELLMSGGVDAIIFSSTAEVCVCTRGYKLLNVLVHQTMQTAINIHVFVGKLIC